MKKSVIRCVTIALTLCILLGALTLNGSAARVEIAESGMQIFIRTLTGKSLNIDVDLFDTIGEIKQMISETVNIPSDQQRLIYKGQMLADECTLEEYGILNGETLNLVIRLEDDILLWLGGTQVTKDNCDAIPSVTEGKASFDPETNTLTLDHVKGVKGAYSDAILRTDLDFLTIRLKGENLLNYYMRDTDIGADYIRKYGILATGEIAFLDDGNGSLSFKGFEKSISAAGCPVTIEGGALSSDMSGHKYNAAYLDDMIRCSTLTIDGGSLSIDGGYSRSDNAMEVGDNEFKDDLYCLDGIGCADFVMTGGSFNAVNCEDAVTSEKEIEIEAGRIDISNGSASGMECGGAMTVGGLNTDLRISTAGDYGIRADSLTLTEDVAIVSPAGAYSGTKTICCQDGSPATELRIATKTHTVTIDVGDLGEDLVVSVKRGERFFDALYHQGVFGTLGKMENEDVIFRDLATKPLTAFADEIAFSKDAGALLDTTVTSDMTVYAGFYQKIKSVNLTLKKPAAGLTVTITEADKQYTQSPTPEIILADDAHCSLCDGSAIWHTDTGGSGFNAFEGQFEAGETYLADFLLMSDFGYWLNDDTVVIANGAEVESSYGSMQLFVTLSAQAAPLLGDANGDGDVDIVDATVIQRYLADFDVNNEYAVLNYGDVTGDGIDILDATYVQRFLAQFHDPYRIGQPIEIQ